MKKTMAPHDTREIVIEFEKVQMIRKRARTILSHCRGCGGEKDFVGVRAAAGLFGITAHELSSFVASNAVHLSQVDEYDSGLCVASLLDCLQQKQNGRSIKFISAGNDS